MFLFYKKNTPIIIKSPLENRILFKGRFFLIYQFNYIIKPDIFNIHLTFLSSFIKTKKHPCSGMLSLDKQFLTF